MISSCGTYTTFLETVIDGNFTSGGTGVFFATEFGSVNDWSAMLHVDLCLWARLASFHDVRHGCPDARPASSFVVKAVGRFSS